MRNFAVAPLLAVALFLAPFAFSHEGHHRPAAAVPAARPAVSEAATMARHMRMPEYWHVLLNPIPPLGMISGGVVLAASFAFPAAAEPGLTLVAVAGAVTWPTIELGQRAYDRLYDTLPREGQQWLDVHMARAEDTQWLFYLAAVVAAAALIARRKRWRAAGPLRAASLILAAACAAAAGWIAHAGGQVSHPEFRAGPPTAEALRIIPARGERR